ncbi:hypothetical protein EFP66_15950, partial [Lacticaseibacillus paracasei]|nr:hypothetical protein [Lacticaseibacillus paracasei]
VASLKVIHARNPSFLGTQYTKIKSARKICTRTVQGKAVIHKLNTSDRLHIYTLQRLSWEMVA